MRNRFGRLLAAAVMMAALAVPSAMAQETAGGMYGSKPAARDKGPEADDHPAIVKAMAKLNEAREILNQHAKNDFEGHKHQALKAIDDAVEQLKICEKMKQ